MLEWIAAWQPVRRFFTFIAMLFRAIMEIWKILEAGWGIVFKVRVDTDEMEFMFPGVLKV